MPTSPQAEVTGAYNLVFRYTINGYQTQIPGVVPMTSDGLEAIGANAQQVQGNVATGGAESGNAVKIGGPVKGAAPTSYSIGQRVDAWFTTQGALVTGGIANDPSLSVALAALMPAINAGSPTALGVSPMVYNGSVLVSQRGDTAGTDTVSAVRATAGGATQFRRLASADTNLAVVKASAGRVYGYVITNTTAAAKFVKLYNKASAPTLASDVPLRTIMVPPNGIVAYHVGMGLGGFSAGIAIAATGAIGDTDTTALAANDLIIHIDYA